MTAGRTYPLARPTGHKPPMQRWRIEFPDDPIRIHTAYIGVQRHDSARTTLPSFEEAVEAIPQWLDAVDPHARPVSETFNFLEGDDALESVAWVFYWSNPTAYETCIQRLNLADIYNRIGRPTTVGIWCERFTTQTSRLETNYSGLDYLPGLAKLPGCKPVEHTLTAYWGAARDRIPDSGHDLFSRQTEDVTQPPAEVPAGLGQHLTGSNQYDNLVHIRSGQFWENCDTTEASAYETTLEPTLRAGLRYLWENRADSGAIGLRFLQNLHDTSVNGSEAKETCAAGFFRSLEDLERWSKRHPSHLAIFNGAIKHAKTFGENRKLRTWHEVSVLKKGEAQFEYVNCLPKTGVVQNLVLAETSI
ncbi:phenylacetaldoxime dehydratase family protein [Aspergillus lucknowensis]|uniref:Heme-containing dehydratase protein n=1 Tax=Aspergillus lucknowensis TaxID=176173 RepID=A0ABR4M0E9_9EURO